MRRNWRRNGVVAAMLVLVGAAVFLNWKYTGEAGEAAAQEAGTKILGQSTLVSGTGDAAAGSGGEDLAADGGDGEAVYTGSDYFASARLTRQQARDNAIDLLEKAAG